MSNEIDNDLFEHLRKKPDKPSEAKQEEAKGILMDFTRKKKDSRFFFEQVQKRVNQKKKSVETRR